MSRAKSQVIKLPAVSVKAKTKNVRSLLDMNLRVKEVNDKMEVTIRFEQHQIINLFKYFLEKTINSHFGFVFLEDENTGDNLSSGNRERKSVYRIDRKSALSEREVEILQKLSNGWTNKEIALHLKITANTVRNHLQSIYLKLGVSNRLTAVTEYHKLFETTK